MELYPASVAEGFQPFLDSIVVSISACHVEGPGSIPGRGGNFLEAKMARIVYLNI